MEGVSIECRKTKTEPTTYQFDYSIKVIAWLLSKLNWKQHFVKY